MIQEGLPPFFVEFLIERTMQVCLIKAELKKGELMRYLNVVFLVLVMFLAACSSEEQPETYSMIFVSDEENISETFTKYIGNTVIEYEHITSLKAAQEKYPKYDIDKAPAILIFKNNGGELKKLELKTYDIEEAKDWLEDNK